MTRGAGIEPLDHGCSIAAALGLPDEQSPTAEAFLSIMQHEEVWVPSLWWHEIGNVIASAKRRKHITDSDASGLLQLYASLPLHTDTAHGGAMLDRVHRMATSSVVLTTKYGKAMRASPQSSGTSDFCFLP
ncbi:MAG: type II toxin-antitoxin system VapC family toxin [Mariprofundaceae bacterium]|nr:type II toxin-antitoxin system VapC family toxin [Mariprofundaceae bacterium]